MATHVAPLVVSVTELLRHPGKQRELRIDTPLDDLAMTSSQVVAGSDVAVRLVLEAMSDSAVTATGTVSASWTGECRRCLAPVEGAVATHVREIYDAKPVEGETYPLSGDRIDLEPMVRDAVLLALPLAPLCEEACTGPEPEDHPLGAVTDPEPDDRWAPLRDLKFD